MKGAPKPLLWIFNTLIEGFELFPDIDQGGMRYKRIANDATEPQTCLALFFDNDVVLMIESPNKKGIGSAEFQESHKIVEATAGQRLMHLLRNLSSRSPRSVSLRP
jgi:hypothetical protein